MSRSQSPQDTGHQSRHQSDMVLYSDGGPPDTRWPIGDADLVAEVDEYDGCDRGATSDPGLPSAEPDFADDADLEDAQNSDSDRDPATSTPGSLPRFSEGRALLLGVAETQAIGTSSRNTLSNVEADVARSLRDHWMPQKF